MKSVIVIGFLEQLFILTNNAMVYRFLLYVTNSSPKSFDITSLGERVTKLIPRFINFKLNFKFKNPRYSIVTIKT